MAWGKRGLQSTTWDWCMPAVWAAVSLVGAAAVAALSLPWETSVYGHSDPRDFLRGEWLVAGSLLALPIVSAARASWRLAPLVIVLPSAQMLYIADTGVENLRAAGLAGDTTDLWYVLAVIQTTVFVVAGLTAAYRGFVDDRWARRMRRMMAEPASRAGGWRISRHGIT